MKKEQEIIVTVGLPGSGKTTWARQQSGYVVLDSDDIREELCGDAATQCNPKTIFDTLYQRALDAINGGNSVIICATNIKRKDRLRLIKFFRNATPDVYLCALMFATPYNECCRRNEMRDRVVPPEAMHRMKKQMTYPAWFEGWDKINIIKET